MPNERDWQLTEDSTARHSKTSEIEVGGSENDWKLLGVSDELSVIVSE